MRRKQWTYYEHMCFLKAHVEMYGLADGSSNSDSPKSGSTNQNPTKRTKRDPIELEEEADYADYDVHQDQIDSAAEEHQVEYITFEAEDQEHEETVYEISSKHHEEKETHLEEEPPEEISSHSDDKSTEQVQVKYVCTDPDERFLLSCAPVLKRLSVKKNALLKMKIQQLLYEVEFGD